MKLAISSRKNWVRVACAIVVALSAQLAAYSCHGRLDFTSPSACPQIVDHVSILLQPFWFLGIAFGFIFSHISDVAGVFAYIAGATLGYAMLIWVPVFMRANSLWADCAIVMSLVGGFGFFLGDLRHYSFWAIALAMVASCLPSFAYHAIQPTPSS